MRKVLYFQVAISLFLKSSFAMIPDFSKLDSNGKFKSFSGVTVISAVHQADLEKWERLHDSLNKNSLITDYYALLPAQSYHMTAFNLFTEKGCQNQSWETFISSRLIWFQELVQKLKVRAFEPEISIGEPFVSGTISILVSLNKHQVDLYSIGRDFDLFDGLPDSFHITLGYLHKEVSSEVRKKITLDIREILTEIFGSQNMTVELQELKLNYFHDMTNFVPWSGEYNPF